MSKFLGHFIRDESGAVAAEFALILGIMGVGIAAAAVTLSGAISTAMTDTGTCVSNNGAGC